MTAEALTAGKIGVLTMVSSVAIEQASTAPNFLPFVVPAISGVLGAVFSYAILKNTVETLSKQHDKMQGDLHAIRDTTHTTAERVARIEGTMERRGQPRG